MNSNNLSKKRGEASPAWRQVRRVGAILGGCVLIVVGTVMLVVPGPGIAAIIGGLVLLSSEFAWARDLLEKLRAKIGLQPRKSSEQAGEQE